MQAKGEHKVIKLDYKAALIKAQATCAYQERHQAEIRDKLYSWGLYTNEVEEIIVALITDNFLNEERYAKAFVSGKYRIKKWGRIKIKVELKQKKISDYSIQKGLKEIDGDVYLENLRSVLLKKNSLLKEKMSQQKLYKLAKFAASKGYENDLIWDELNKLK